MSVSKKTGRRVDKSSRSTDENPGGYGRPPVPTRFPQGKSGNPHGRPKGHRNIANLTKDLLNRPVRVRSGGETLEMGAIEAIVRVLTNEAAQGNSRATSLVNKLREMAGFTNEITEEEHQRSSMRLPRAPSVEEYDLLRAPAREKDRQKYLAMAEFNDVDSEVSDDGASTAEIIPPAIKAGDELAVQGKFDEALAAYRSQLALCKTELAANSNNKTAQYNFRRAIARIGLVANTLLFAGDFAQALKIADEATSQAASEFWGTPEEIHGQPYTNTGWINHIRAHALMFLGQVDKARSYFLGFHTNRRDGYTSWEYVTLREFVQLRRIGYSHPLMSEIEGRLAAAGWVRDTTEDLPPGANRGLNRVADIKLGDMLARESKLDEAVVVYRRILTECKTDLAKDRNNRPTQAGLYFVAGRIGHMAEQFLLAGKFAETVSCADEAIGYDSYSTSFNLNRAHALMWLGRMDEARAIYFEYHGKRMSIRRWCQEAIREDFSKLRKAGHSHNLMDEVERRFGGAKFDKSLSVGSGEGGSAIGENGAYGQSAKGGSLSRTAALAARSYAKPTKPSVLPLNEREDMASGDALLSQGSLDGAFAVYKRRIERCDQIIAKGVHNMQAHDDRHLAVNKINDISLRYLLAGQNEKSLASIDYVLSVVPNSPYASVRRAHALMFLGREHEARVLYFQCLQYREQKITPEQTGAAVILQDFDRMHKFDRLNTLMDEIESLFRAPTP